MGFRGVKLSCCSFFVPILIRINPMFSESSGGWQFIWRYKHREFVCRLYIPPLSSIGIHTASQARDLLGVILEIESFAINRNNQLIQHFVS